MAGPDEEKNIPGPDKIETMRVEENGNVLDAIIINGNLAEGYMSCPDGSTVEYSDYGSALEKGNADIIMDAVKEYRTMRAENGGTPAGPNDAGSRDIPRIIVEEGTGTARWTDGFILYFDENAELSDQLVSNGGMSPIEKACKVGPITELMNGVGNLAEAGESTGTGLTELAMNENLARQQGKQRES